MKKVLVLIFVSLIVCLLSCEKDELTIPVEVEFEFTMNPFQMEGSTKAPSFFDINEGTILIESIEFDGRRDVGEDYYFTSDFTTPISAQMHNQTLSQHISFDIPQGIYNHIDLNLSIGDGDGYEYALCLQGKFQRGPMEEILIRVEYAFQENIRIRAQNKLGNEQIVLTKDSGLKARAVFDVPQFFQMINMNMIKNAEIEEVDGGKMIIINHEKNTDIFNLLVNRLDNSMRVIFE